jgi:hypothetical protein
VLGCGEGSDGAAAMGDAAELDSLVDSRGVVLEWGIQSIAAPTRAESTAITSSTILRILFIEFEVRF